MRDPGADAFRVLQAYELATLTGTEVLLLVVSETGIVSAVSMLPEELD